MVDPILDATEKVTDIETPQPLLVDPPKIDGGQDRDAHAHFDIRFYVFSDVDFHRELVGEAMASEDVFDGSPDFRPLSEQNKRKFGKVSKMNPPLLRQRVSFRGQEKLVKGLPGDEIELRVERLLQPCADDQVDFASENHGNQLGGQTSVEQIEFNPGKSPHELPQDIGQDVFDDHMACRNRQMTRCPAIDVLGDSLQIVQVIQEGIHKMEKDSTRLGQFHHIAQTIKEFDA